MSPNITLVPGGYFILDADDKILVDQSFDPFKPFIEGRGQPFDTDEIALAHAQAVLAEMSPQEPV